MGCVVPVGGVAWYCSSDLLEILSMGIKGWESLFQQDFFVHAPGSLD